MLAVVVCRDVDDLYRYLAERLAGIDHIQSYDISIRTQRLKQAASLIAHGRLIHPGHASDRPLRRSQQALLGLLAEVEGMNAELGDPVAVGAVVLAP